MGSFIEINDTLRINKAQGFPRELDVEAHFKNPYVLQDFEGRIFSFQSKPKIRIYKIPPVRNFLVEEVNGKWIYWGLCHVVETTLDYKNEITSGKFIITYINTPEQMRQAFQIADRRTELDYFTVDKKGK